MAKSKTPSPQELYRARKAREDKERLALLPPGLVNHGNTCFMNSVLQGLIATHYLHLLVHFQPLPLSQPCIASHRSPALTNGHGIAPEHDHPWSDALPISDHLIALLRTAWDIQDNRRREYLSPKDILAAIGNKYDQYLDFRQQDAHEFLCQLLDAIRMEEMDVIKQRSPPPKKTSKRSHSSRSHYPTTPHSSAPADGESCSFVDMLFGGKLASILVCQTCKHVSHTYEDFTDLSLSMKPEDYVRERRRDKLKQFAKKIGTALYVGVPQPRSSSVPATPVRDSNLVSSEHNDTQRRRSIDLADVEVVAQPVSDNQAPGDVTRHDTAIHVLASPSLIPDVSLPETPIDTVPVTDLSVPVPPQELPGDHTMTALSEKLSERSSEKERRDEDESWTKISRRITVSVGLAKRPKIERKDKKVTPSATPSKPVDEGSPFYHVSSAPVTAETLNETAPPLERESTSLGLVNEKLQAHLTNVKRSVMPTQRSGNSPSGSSAPRFPLISRPSSPVTHSKPPKPRPPKLSSEEAAYLRDILADINPPNIPKSFSLFKQSKEPSSTPSFNSQNIFLKVNQINRIEECLRLFTSVEVLNGDNTVRCHRCWKIANGSYKPRARGSAHETDSCTDSEDDEAVDAKPNGNHSIPPRIELALPTKNDTPTTRVIGIPSISTTPPDSPMSPPQTAKPPPSRANAVVTQTSTVERASRISLSAPSDHHRQHGSRNGDSNTESEISEGESETLLSVYSDVSSVMSSNPSLNASRDHLRQPSPPRAKDKDHPSGVPRSRQYLLRPAYKRYLIATPPPILVVHLKRFQQLSKMPVVSFSTGFKKMDDYISFPEHLDLAPYLAPRREDYFDSKVAVMRGRAKRPAPCMYRLYAVVVHIGNMLGGHYVAYTALPPTPTSDADTGRSESESKPRGTEPRDWAFISDTIVRLASLEEVLKSKAYICMYERI